MSRLNTIALDASAGSAPAEWSPEWVQRRLVEAYSIERRLPNVRRKKTAGGSWPAISYEFADVVGWTDARDRVLDVWAHDRAGVFAAELKRMEEAHEWLRTILAKYETERLCLAHWAACIAYRRSLRRLLAQRRWSRTSFYRRIAIGSLIIAVQLKERGEAVR